jgi:hypothetical protein
MSSDELWAQLEASLSAVPDPGGRPGWEVIQIVRFDGAAVTVTLDWYAFARIGHPRWNVAFPAAPDAVEHVTLDHALRRAPDQTSEILAAHMAAVRHTAKQLRIVVDEYRTGGLSFEPPVDQGSFPTVVLDAYNARFTQLAATCLTEALVELAVTVDERQLSLPLAASVIREASEALLFASVSLPRVPLPPAGPAR